MCLGGEMPKEENQPGLYTIINYENANGTTLSFTMQVMPEEGGDPDDSVFVSLSTKDDAYTLGFPVPADVLVAMLKRILGES